MFQLTSVEITNSFIARIKEVNPLLNCVVDDRFIDALKEAENVDKIIASGTLSEEQLAKEKPFYGVPISTKDCIEVEGDFCNCLEIQNSFLPTIFLMVRFAMHIWYLFTTKLSIR
jgi:Asp-tRNA(Asn)/Glu-tRNA(Gln) amidotransferase A subunit family amidase